MIDFHCHIDLYPRPEQVINEVEKRGAYVLAVTTTPTAFKGNIRLIRGTKRIKVAVGLHPELVNDRFQEVDLVCDLMNQTNYVGEVGLDGSLNHKASLPKQRDALRRILASCSENRGKIVSLHSRMATVAVLDEIEIARPFGIPILHWFSGSNRDLDRAIALGCWFSVGPAMLRAEKSLALISRMPRERLLTETDGPFVQINGRSAVPWDVAGVEGDLAELWGLTQQDVSLAIRGNLRSLTSLENTVI